MFFFKTTPKLLLCICICLHHYIKCYIFLWKQLSKLLLCTCLHYQIKCETIEIVLTIQSIICFIYTINYLITNLQNHTNLSWYKLDEELVLTIESITSFIYTINYLISNLLNYTNLSWCKLDEGFWLSNLLWTKQIISWFWSWRIMVVVRKMSGLVK